MIVKNMKNKRKVIVLLLFLCTFFLPACDSNRAGSSITPTPGLSDPSAAVVSNIGAVNNVVLNDHQDFREGLVDNIVEIVEVNIDFSNINVTSQFATQDITFNDLLDNTFTADIPLDELEFENNVQVCSGGGSKEFVGTLTLTVDANNSSGILDGDYALLYSACIESVLFVTSDGNCSIDVQIEGAFVNNIDMEFIDIQRATINNVLTAHDIMSNGGLTFSNDGGSNQSVSYNYSVVSSPQLGNDTFSGSLTFETLDYDVKAIDDFIANSTTGAICP